jgi:S1-C subfamily serine protease
VTLADVIVVAWVAISALVGFRRGLAAQALALGGFAAGAWVGSRLAPHALSASARVDWAPVAALVGAIACGALAQMATAPIASLLRRRVLLGPLATIDGAGGMLVGAALGVGVAWLLAVTALQQPELGLRRTVQTSTILPRLVHWLPAQSLLDAIARFDQLPVIAGHGVDSLPPPDRSVPVSPAVRRAEHSVLIVEGTSCGLTLQGSGWVVRPGLVVTNAHVVAGEQDTRVLPGGRGPGLRAQTVVFDPHDDVAILRVAGLNAPALSLAAGPQVGTAGAILGFPLDGPFDVRAGRLGVTRTVITQDAYGRGPVRRTIAALRGAVRPGNSGGPMVDAAGRVLTTVFAATTRGPRGGYGVPNVEVRKALAGARGPVSTGPCA